MVGDRVVVDLADAAFLGPHAAGEIAEMVDAKRQVRRSRLAYRLAVVDRLYHRQQIELLLHPVGNAQQQAGPLGGGRAAPRLARRVRRIQRQLDVLGTGTRHRADHLAVDRRDVVEIPALHRRHPFAANEVVVLRPYGDVLGYVL